MVGVLHVDEVDDDDAAEIAQAQLPRDHLRRLEIGLEDRVVEAAAADEAAGVDVDRRHRLGLVDDQVAARLQVDAARQRLLDLVLDPVQIVQRPIAGVMLDAIEDVLRVLAGEFLHLLERLARIDQDPRRFLGRHVAQHPLREVQILVDQRRRRNRARFLGQVAPQLGQVLDVVLHFALAGGLRHRADDEAAGEPFRQQLLQLLAQHLALGLVLDALRDADMRVLRQVDQQPSGQADLRRQPRALGADRILDHLDQQRLALVQDALDRPVFMAVLAVLPDVGDVQERGALESDLDERRLHSRQDARDPAQIDVADQAARAGALDVQLLHDALLEHRYARLLRRDVDEDVVTHGMGALRCRRKLGRGRLRMGERQPPRPAASNGQQECTAGLRRLHRTWNPILARISAVSNSGRPITPE